jgi:drug/metabolite transporter (DMT)-like permease
MPLEDKYTGLVLAITSSLAIGSSYVITKVGLKDASERHGFDGEGHQYMKNPIWWLGMVTLILGELANFAAYAFAPAILVTPLGALSVLTGAVLGAYFLKEELGKLGWLGCAICIIGSVIIASHAPPDKEIETVDEILQYAIQPGTLRAFGRARRTFGADTLRIGFLFYCIFSAVFSAVMIYRIAPKYGKTNPLYYLSICASTGSVSVMAIKAFGIALKLTFSGNNQFTHPSTYAFAIVTIVCIMTQMNYFNKALNTFPQSMCAVPLDRELRLC